MVRLKFPAKQIRAKVIWNYMLGAGHEKAVCFSSGNAARELEKLGVNVLHIGPQGLLQTEMWWSPTWIHRYFPDRFDATSGHLPIPLMVQIAIEFNDYLGVLEDETYEVPTGSGETLLCLRWAYPNTVFVPVFNLDEHTQYDPRCPLAFLLGYPALERPDKIATAGDL